VNTTGLDHRAFEHPARQRRAAQRLVGIAMEGLKQGCPPGAPPPEPAAVIAALEKALVACTSK
jgi:hypothetical protein